VVLVLVLLGVNRESQHPLRGTAFVLSHQAGLHAIGRFFTPTWRVRTRQSATHDRVVTRTVHYQRGPDFTPAPSVCPHISAAHMGARNSGANQRG
jgi:hypothetical protein